MIFHLPVCIAVAIIGLLFIALSYLRRPVSDFAVIGVTRDRRNSRQLGAAAWNLNERRDQLLTARYNANVKRNMIIRHGTRKAFLLEHWA
jgi:hypothetical protein